MRIALILKIVFFNFILLSCHVAKAQQSEVELIDSIRKENLHLLDNKQLVDNYNKIAFAYGSTDLDSSLHYSNKGEILASKINYKKGLALSYSYIARASIEASRLTSATENFHKALDLYLQENDSINILNTYTGLSYVSSYQSNLFATLNYNLTAIKYAESLKDTSSLSVIYNNIGAVYKQLNNYELALTYFKKSLALDIAKNDLQGIINGHSNIGILKVEHGKVLQAAADFKMIKENLSKVDNEYMKAYLHVSLSKYYNEINAFDSSLIQINKAYALCSQNNYSHIKARVYKIHGELLFKEKQYQKGIHLLNRSLHLYKQLGLQEKFPEIYGSLSESYAKLGLYSKAYHAARKEKSFVDSLQINRVNLFLNEFEEQNQKNELERLHLVEVLKDQQIANAKIILNNRTKTSIITISLLLVIIFIVGFYYTKTKSNNLKLKKSENELKKLNAAKDKFLSIISHDLKSPFNAIGGFGIELCENYDDYTDEQRKKMIRIIKEASDSAIDLLNNLLSWARSQSGTFELYPEKIQLSELINHCISSYISAAKLKEIQIFNQVSTDVFVYTDKETIQVVVCNLINNAIKYSHKNGKIRITATEESDKIECCLSDDGIGMNENIKNALFKIEENVQRHGTADEEGTGLGLILCKEFVSKNGGEIRVESEENQGSSFYFTLPTA